MTIVLDTNVVVSAVLRPEGTPGRVLDLVLARRVTAAFDARIFAEYREVLARPELALPVADVRDVLDFLWRSGTRVRATPLALSLPDPDDAKFVEVAVAALAAALVTGNRRHFPPERCHGVPVKSPREWLDAWAG